MYCEYCKREEPKDFLNYKMVTRTKKEPRLEENICHDCLCREMKLDGFCAIIQNKNSESYRDLCKFVDNKGKE